MWQRILNHHRTSNPSVLVLGAPKQWLNINATYGIQGKLLECLALHDVIVVFDQKIANTVSRSKFLSNFLKDRLIKPQNVREELVNGYLYQTEMFKDLKLKIEQMKQTAKLKTINAINLVVSKAKEKKQKKIERKYLKLQKLKQKLLKEAFEIQTITGSDLFVQGIVFCKVQHVLKYASIKTKGSLRQMFIRAMELNRIDVDYRKYVHDFLIIYINQIPTHPE